MRPREYLSYSQKRLWKQSPDKYMEQYVHNGARFITREMAFGSKMAIALEEMGTEKIFDTEWETDDPELNKIAKKLPRLDKAECEVRTDLKIDGEVIPLYSRLDTAKLDLTAFKDYKTGKEPWTQKRADEDKQITFYVTAIYILTKKIVQDIEIVWIPTVDDLNSPLGISVTGEIKIFKTKRNISHIINEMADMRKVWREIGERCELELI